MYKTIRILVLIGVYLIDSSFSIKQGQKNLDFYEKIKSYDISNLFVSDSIETEAGLSEVKSNNSREPLLMSRCEPLGFIGDSFQRFYIHFLTVTKNPKNPYEYIVTGKTKVKDNICKFNGTITINEAKLYGDEKINGEYRFFNDSSDNKKYGNIYNEGYIKCTYLFHEDKLQNGSGLLSGVCAFDWCFDKHKKLVYDVLGIESDAYNNNNFEGIWKSYKTGIVKKCNWGDWRIPDSGDLDIGAAEFSVNDKYKKFGWASYEIEKEQSLKNLKEIENQKWWKQHD